MSLLVTATLAFAILIAIGAVGLVRPSTREDGTMRSDAPSGALRPSPQSAEEETRSDLGAASADDGPLRAPSPGMARLKRLLHGGEWRRALPSLLVIAGLLGVMLFGSLSLIYVFGQPTAGVASLLVLVGTLGWLAWDYSRS